MKIPFFVIRIMNPVVSLILRSPLHSVLSKDTMLITFTGRKTGREYTTPVSFVRDGDRVRVFTVAPWWRNLITNPEVKLVLQRNECAGDAAIVKGDKERIDEALQDFVKRVPRDKPYFNRGPDDEFDGTQTMEGKRLSLVLIEIHL